MRLSFLMFFGLVDLVGKGRLSAPGAKPLARAEAGCPPILGEPHTQSIALTGNFSAYLKKRRRLDGFRPEVARCRQRLSTNPTYMDQHENTPQVGTKRAKQVLGVIVIVLVLAAGACAVYLLGQDTGPANGNVNSGANANSQNNVNSTGNLNSTVIIDTSNWTLLDSTDYSIKYPPTWELTAASTRIQNYEPTSDKPSQYYAKVELVSEVVAPTTARAYYDSVVAAGCTVANATQSIILHTDTLSIVECVNPQQEYNSSSIHGFIYDEINDTAYHANGYYWSNDLRNTVLAAIQSFSLK